MSGLDKYFYSGYKLIYHGGTLYPAETVLELTGSGVSVADDPVSGRTVATFTVGGGSDATSWYAKDLDAATFSAPASYAQPYYDSTSGTWKTAQGLHLTGSIVFDKALGAGSATVRIADATTTASANYLELKAQLPQDGNGGDVRLTATDGVGSNRSAGGLVFTFGAKTGSGVAATARFVASSLASGVDLWTLTDVSGAMWVNGSITSDGLAGSNSLLYVSGGTGLIRALANPAGAGAVPVYDLTGSSHTEWLESSGTPGDVLTLDGGGLPSWAAGGGGGGSLSATLAIGNTTGGHNIAISVGDLITGAGLSISDAGAISVSGDYTATRTDATAYSIVAMRRQQAAAAHVNANDILGILYFDAWDGSAYQRNGAVYAFAEADASAGVAPVTVAIGTSATNTAGGITAASWSSAGVQLLPNAGAALGIGKTPGSGGGSGIGVRASAGTVRIGYQGSIYARKSDDSGDRHVLDYGNTTASTLTIGDTGAASVLTGSALTLLSTPWTNPTASNQIPVSTGANAFTWSAPVQELYTFSALSISTTIISLTGGTSSIQTRTAAGLFQVYVDNVNVAFGDVFNVILYEKPLVGGTQRSKVIGTLTGAEQDPWVSEIYMLDAGWDFAMVKVSGTDRTFSGSVRQAWG